MSNSGLTIWQTLLNDVKGGLVTNFASFVTAVSATAASLVGTEAQDADSLITSFTQLLEAGTPIGTAWSQALAAYEPQAKSDAWKAFTQGVAEVATFVDSIVKVIEAAI